MGIRRIFYGFSVALWLFSGAAGVSFAQAPEILPGCDPEYMDAMEARAWLHGQRRVSMNQSLIYKPDSVLEYSCFGARVAYLASNSARRFSENYPFPAFPTWTPQISYIDERSLDTALEQVVLTALAAYIGNNFGHTYLGGRAPFDSGGCSDMQMVWKFARCINFADPQFQDVDDFYDFPWYASNDPRVYPTDYGTCTPPANIIRGAMVESYRAEGKTSGDEWVHFVLQEENNPYINDGTPYEEDHILVDEILDKVLPGDCGDSWIIKTGVTVDIPRMDEWEERFCVMPACSFDYEEEGCTN